jgi:branched-chain amino acid transport system substrate-binding protein
LKGVWKGEGVARAVRGAVGLAASLACVAALLMPSAAQAGPQPAEIRVGHLAPYSGPASAYGVIGKAIGAWFDKVNAEGGVRGRRLVLVSRDDGYNPAKALEMTRRLVEQDEVLLVFNPLGTATNTAIRKYLNDRGVPHLFVASGATKWGDPQHFPWTMGGQPSYQAEARIYAEHILETRPDARIAVLYQNDDYGKDYLKGLRDGLGARADAMIVAQASYEVADPTVDSQMVALKASGADVFFNVTTPKFAAQAIRRAAELGWRPLHYLNNVSSGAGSVMVPAGAENGVGVISAFYQRDPSDPQWAHTPEWRAWREWMRAWHPRGDVSDNLNVYGYNLAQLLVKVLEQAGDDLSRENVMRQAARLDATLPMLLPGVNVKTGPDDYFPFERARLARWDGRTWVLFGKVYGR